jgi:hypothetical protein
MSETYIKLSWREAMAGVAQGAINVTEELSQIERDSYIHHGMAEVCRMVNEAEKGEAPCPICRERSKALHEQVEHLFWKFRDAEKLPAEDFAEFLLITLHRLGALAPQHKPDVGKSGGESWPKRDNDTSGG